MLNTKHNALTDEDILQIVKVLMYSNNIESIRDRIILFLLLTTNITPTELSSLKLRNVKKLGNLCLIEVSKRKTKNKYVLLPNLFKRQIDDYLEMRGLDDSNSDSYLIANRYGSWMSTAQITKAVKTIIEKAGLEINPNGVLGSVDMGRFIQNIENVSYGEGYESKFVNSGALIKEIDDECFADPIKMINWFDK